MAYAMSSSASPAITEAVGDEDQGGPPSNSGPVAIASGMPAVMINPQPSLDFLDLPKTMIF
jgi:hypothetical protein